MSGIRTKIRGAAGDETIAHTVLPRPNLAVCGFDFSQGDFLAAVSGVAPHTISGTMEDGELERFSNRYFDPASKRDARPPPQWIIKQYCGAEPQCTRCPLRYVCSYANSAPSQKKVNGTFADLFCGAGGLSLGFEKVGFMPRLALDADYWSTVTFKVNRPGIEKRCDVVCSDIRAWLDSSPRLPPVDIVAGGVPCQPFSNANQQRKDQDPRQNLFELFFESVDRIRPRIVLIENVSGFRKVGHLVEDAFEYHGYAAASVLIDAFDYGVPQRRKRLFYIGVSNDRFPNAKTRASSIVIDILKSRVSKKNTLRDAIGDLPVLQPVRVKNRPAYESDHTGRALLWHDPPTASDYVRELNGDDDRGRPLFNHKSRYNNDRDIEIFSRLEPGDDSLAPQIADLMPYASRNDVFADKYFRLRYSEPSRAITAHMRWDCNSYIHPEQSRGLTAREAARVQGFPDDYVFVGTFQRLYQQVGNAVPPHLAVILARAIQKGL